MIIRDFATARHLASRLEMGIDKALCQTRIGLEVKQVFATLLPAKNHVTQTPKLTSWQEAAAFYTANITQQHDTRLRATADANQLADWWTRQLHRTQYPLLERMTLFWHNHFATSMDKVVWPQLMLHQNQLLRKHALGNFADLLRDMMHDPALLLLLDSDQNQVKDLNANAAHALLEHFTLGTGRFTTNDVTAAARAFTGWQFEPESGTFQFHSEQHDNGVKVFKGQRGKFNSDDIIDLLLREARTAEYIAEKFWAAFINHDTPDPELIKAWATEFRDSGYEIQTLLQAIIHSPPFWNKQNRGTLIKSPVELSVGLLRELNIPLAHYTSLRKAHQQLGQDLLSPPSTTGWAGGNSWITNARLSRRYDVITKLLAEHSAAAKNLKSLANEAACIADDENTIRWLLPLEPMARPNCDQPTAAILQTLLTDPVYQLR